MFLACPSPGRLATYTLRGLSRRLVTALLFPLRVIRKLCFWCRSRRRLDDFIGTMGISSGDASGHKAGGVAGVKTIFLGDEAKSKEERRLVQKLGKMSSRTVRSPLRC